MLLEGFRRGCLAKHMLDYVYGCRSYLSVPEFTLQTRYVDEAQDNLIIDALCEEHHQFVNFPEPHVR